MKSADGGNSYKKDEEFLNDCGNWVYFCNKNKCSENDLIWDELSKKIKLDDNLLRDAKNIMTFAKINK
jgi:hypothetical protein